MTLSHKLLALPYVEKLCAQTSPRARRFALIAGVVVFFDQWSKYLAVSRLTRAFIPLGEAPSLSERIGAFISTSHPRADGVYTVFDWWWNFRYVENPGAAWSFLAGASASFRVPFFLAISCVAMILLLQYFRYSLPQQKLLRFALALVFGGAIGNFLDRARLGYVIDFIEWHIGHGPLSLFGNQFTNTWPIFNIADAGISVGVVLMMYDMLVNGDPHAVQRSESKPTQPVISKKDTTAS